eukprot:scaffold5681_cov196-Alexandrium_tamarense.AAC.13
MNNSHVFLTRHGARVDTEDQQWLRKCSHNRSDDPHLSSAGRKGALELAAEIARQVDGCTVAHIVSSPYVRCVETAHIVAEVIGVDVKIEPGIAEVKSSRTPGFLDVVELQRQYPLIDTTYTPIMASGDLSREYSDGACAKRSSNTAKRVREQLEGTILFVGHGASCCGVAGAFGQRGYVGYTILTHFVRYDTKWKLDGEFGSVAHLSDKQTSLDSAW